VRLREIVFHDAEQRRKLEAILHPLIRERWMAQARTARGSSEWLIVDIPLLYEKELEGNFDAVVVVACRASTQRARIVLERGLSPEIAERIIAAQQSLASKIARATYIAWSDSPEARLGEQAQILATHLKGRFHETH
jgi:dephospho-CoA kinase